MSMGIRMYESGDNFIACHFVPWVFFNHFQLLILYALLKLKIVWKAPSQFLYSYRRPLHVGDPCYPKVPFTNPRSIIYLLYELE